MLPYTHGSRRLDDGIHTCAGKPASITNLKPVVLNERAKDIGIPRQLALRKSRHHAAWIGQGDIKSNRVPDCQLATHPVVLDEPPSSVATITFIRNRRSSKLLLG